MVAVFQFGEDNGPAVGAPPAGTRRTLGVTQCNWKSRDDVDTPIDSPAAVITAGDSSCTKYQFGAFTGPFTTIANAKWSHTAGELGPGLTLKGRVTSDYETPTTAPNPELTQDMTALTPVASGQAVLFSEIGPQDQAPTATLTAPGFTQYLATQLQTASYLTNETTDEVILSLAYDEH